MNAVSTSSTNMNISTGITMIAAADTITDITTMTAAAVTITNITTMTVAVAAVMITDIMTMTAAVAVAVTSTAKKSTRANSCSRFYAAERFCLRATY